MSDPDVWHDTAPLNDLLPHVERYVREAADCFESSDMNESARRVEWIADDLRSIMPRAPMTALLAVARFMVENAVQVRREAREGVSPE